MNKLINILILILIIFSYADGLSLRSQSQKKQIVMNPQFYSKQIPQAIILIEDSSDDYAQQLAANHTPSGQETENNEEYQSDVQNISTQADNSEIQEEQSSPLTGSQLAIDTVQDQFETDGVDSNGDQIGIGNINSVDNAFGGDQQLAKSDIEESQIQHEENGKTQETQIEQRDGINDANDLEEQEAQLSGGNLTKYVVDEIKQEQNNVQEQSEDAFEGNQNLSQSDILESQIIQEENGKAQENNIDQKDEINDANGFESNINSENLTEQVLNENKEELNPDSKPSIQAFEGNQDLNKSDIDESQIIHEENGKAKETNIEQQNETDNDNDQVEQDSLLNGGNLTEQAIDDYNEQLNQYYGNQQEEQSKQDQFDGSQQDIIDNQVQPPVNEQNEQVQQENQYEELSPQMNDGDISQNVENEVFQGIQNKDKNEEMIEDAFGGNPQLTQDEIVDHAVQTQEDGKPEQSQEQNQPNLQQEEDSHLTGSSLAQNIIKQLKEDNSYSKIHINKLNPKNQIVD